MIQINGMKIFSVSSLYEEKYLTEMTSYMLDYRLFDLPLNVSNNEN